MKTLLSTTVSIAILIALICTSSCNSESSFNTEPNPESDQTLLLQAEADDLCLPVDVVRNLSDEAKSSRKSSIIMAEYMHYDNKLKQYFITISENEAAELGVPSRYYNYAVDYINSINSVLLNMDELIDLKSQIESIKKAKFYYPQKRSLSRGICSPDYMQGDLESAYGVSDSIVLVSYEQKNQITVSCHCTVSKGDSDFSVYPVVVVVETLSPIKKHSNRFSEDVGLFPASTVVKLGITASPDLLWKFTLKETAIGGTCFIHFIQGNRNI